MDELHKQVRRARRRLGARRFFGVLGWCWFATLLAAVVLIAVDKFYPLGVPGWAWAAGALGLGLLGAIAWMLATRRELLPAAIEIDHRYALKERVSSTLALPADQRQSEAARALTADAARRIERIDVAEKFPLTPPKQILLPLVPGLLALLVAVLVSPAAVQKQAGATPDTPAVKKQVEKSADALRRKLAQRRQQANKLGLKDAERLFKKLEEGSKDLAARKPDRKKALTRLNDLSRELKKRRRQLDGSKEVKRQLNQLENNQRGPADKLIKAIGRGDFKEAADEIEKLRKQLAESKLSDEQKEALAKQLDQMKQQLERLAEARREAQEDLQKRCEQLRQAGQEEEANKLEEQLNKLLEQAPQMKQLDDLAEKLGQCSKCMREGQLDDAGDALKDLQAGLNDLEQQLEELKMLDESMQQLSQARDQMNCPNCGGAGCDQCQGEPGLGMGRGQGEGDRPEAESDTDFYDSQVRQRVGRGSAEVVDLVDGPNVKGNVEAEIQQQSDAARSGSTDPLTGRRIPRKHRQHAREYFDRFREGE